MGTSDIAADASSLSDSDRRLLGEYLNAQNIASANAAHPAPVIRDSLYARYGKRILDIALSVPALLVTLPVNVILGVLTYRDVGSPLFFLQERVGKGGKSFLLRKFRNMTNETDEEGNLLPPDQRVTEFGRKVRGASLDELLNFWNVLKGDMSIIGPRPLLPEYTERFSDYHLARLRVKPGLACPQSPDLEDAESWEGQFNQDVWYAENISFATDVKEFVQLFRAVFDKKSSRIRAGAGRSFFIGYNEQGRAISLSDITREYADEVLRIMR